MAGALPLRTSLSAWAVAHLIAIAVWMHIASPLWHLSEEERCPEFGDSLYLLIWVLPSLALGAVCAVWGLTYTCLARDQIGRSSRILSWLLIVIAWCGATAVAYLNIRRDWAIPCAH